MIRQMCPNCVQLIELPDTAAGSTVPCPKCAKPFPVPAPYTPAVDASAGPPPGTAPSSLPAPPPGLVPNAPSVTTPPTPSNTLAPLPTPGGYAHSFTVTLNAIVLKWTPVACLTAILLLSFFPWVGAYPGGVRMHSQMPWQAAFGYFTPNILAEDETVLKELVHANWFLILYVALLVLAIIVAWAERAVRDTDTTKLPGALAWLTPIWPQRFLVLTALTGAMFAILLFQMWRGFGLETALHTLAVQTVENQRSEAEKAKTSLTFAEEQRLAIKTGQEYGKHTVSGTTALDLAMLLHLVALGAAAKLLWLHHRGPTKPPPQVQVRW